MNGPDEKVCEGRIQDAVPEAFAEFQSALQGKTCRSRCFAPVRRLRHVRRRRQRHGHLG